MKVVGPRLGLACDDLAAALGFAVECNQVAVDGDGDPAFSGQPTADLGVHGSGDGGLEAEKVDGESYTVHLATRGTPTGGRVGGLMGTGGGGGLEEIAGIGKEGGPKEAGGMLHEGDAQEPEDTCSEGLVDCGGKERIPLDRGLSLPERERSSLSRKVATATARRTKPPFAVLGSSTPIMDRNRGPGACPTIRKARKGTPPERRPSIEA